MSKSLHSSFRHQLMLRYAASFCVLLVLMAAVTYATLSHCLIQSLDRNLLLIAQSEADFATQNAHLHLHRTHDVLPDQGAYSLPRYVQITDLSSKIIATNHALNPSPIQLTQNLKTLNRSAVPHFENTQIKGADYRIVYLPIQYHQQPYSLQIASPLTSVQETLGQVMSMFWVAGIALLGIAGMLGWRLASTAVQPLAQIASQVAKIDLQGLNQRMPELSRRAPDELKQLSQQLNAMLERLNQSTQALKQFTSDASHELRTPLTILKSELQIALRKERQPEEYRALLHSNLEEVNRLIELAEALLKLARSEQSIELNQLLQGQSDLHAVLSHLQERWQERAARQGVELQLKLTDTHNQIAIHPGYLEQILHNLLDNALQVAPADSVIQIEELKQPLRAGFAVQDQGPGIPAEQQQQIFERFYQVAQARSSNQQHFGIGLSLCQILVQAHRGQIEVQSQPGQGCRFEVWFPTNLIQPSTRKV